MISLFGYHSQSIDLAYPYRFRYAILSFVLLMAASMLIFCSLLNVQHTSLFMLGLCLWVLALSGLRLSVLAFRYGRQMQRAEEQRQQNERDQQDSDVSGHAALMLPTSATTTGSPTSAAALHYWMSATRALSPLSTGGPGGAPPAFSDINVYEYSAAVQPPNPYQQLWIRRSIPAVATTTGSEPTEDRGGAPAIGDHPPPSYTEIDGDSLSPPSTLDNQAPPKYEEIMELDHDDLVPSTDQEDTTNQTEVEDNDNVNNDITDNQPGTSSSSEELRSSPPPSDKGLQSD